MPLERNCSSSPSREHGPALRVRLLHSALSSGGFLHQSTSKPLWPSFPPHSVPEKSLFILSPRKRPPSFSEGSLPRLPRGPPAQRPFLLTSLPVMLAEIALYLSGNLPSFMYFSGGRLAQGSQVSSVSNILRATLREEQPLTCVPRGARELGPS